MKRNGKWFRSALLLALVAAGAGCSGIHASKSISPLDFFLPGLMKNEAPVPEPSAPVPVERLAQLEETGTGGDDHCRTPGCSRTAGSE